MVKNEIIKITKDKKILKVINNEIKEYYPLEQCDIFQHIWYSEMQYITYKTRGCIKFERYMISLLIKANDKSAKLINKINEDIHFKISFYNDENIKIKYLEYASKFKEEHSTPYKNVEQKNYIKTMVYISCLEIFQIKGTMFFKIELVEC